MRLSLFAATVLLAAGTVAHANPVTYTFSGTFTGSLSTTSFTSDPGSITFTGDTSGINSLGAGFFTNTAGTSTITLQNVGTATFLSNTFGAESQTGGAGFFDIATGFGVSIFDPALSGYALTFPFSDTGFFEESFAAASGTTEMTSLGDLMLSGDINSSATFTATGATPEPSSFLLLGTGLLGAAGTLRRRFA